MSSADPKNIAVNADSKLLKEGSENHQDDLPGGPKRLSLMASFEGPLPPPAILEAYDRIVPHGAERIFVSFEKQVAHRQQLEQNVIGANIRMQYLGFFAAFFLATGTIGAGFWFIYLGKGVVGVAAIIAALGSLLTVFILGRKTQDKERAIKRG